MLRKSTILLLFWLLSVVAANTQSNSEVTPRPLGSGRRSGSSQTGLGRDPFPPPLPPHQPTENDEGQLVYPRGSSHIQGHLHHLREGRRGGWVGRIIGSSEQDREYSLSQLVLVNPRVQTSSIQPVVRSQDGNKVVLSSRSRVLSTIGDEMQQAHDGLPELFLRNEVALSQNAEIPQSRNPLPRFSELTQDEDAEAEADFDTPIEELNQETGSGTNEEAEDAEAEADFDTPIEEVNHETCSNTNEEAEAEFDEKYLLDSATRLAKRDGVNLNATAANDVDLDLDHEYTISAALPTADYYANDHNAGSDMVDRVANNDFTPHHQGRNYDPLYDPRLLAFIGHLGPVRFFDFGGAGDCGPASLSGAMNYYGLGIRLNESEDEEEMIYLRGGQYELRQLLVSRARQNPTLMNEIFEFLPELEVRGRGDLQVVRDSEEFLALMAQTGYHFEEHAFRLAAESFRIQISIHSVSYLFLLYSI